jgi:hypothetical protein
LGSEGVARSILRLVVQAIIVDSNVRGDCATSQNCRG